MDGDQKFLLASLATLFLTALVTLPFVQGSGAGINLGAANGTNSTLTSSFTETGLPDGTQWIVTFGSSVNSSTSSTVRFVTPPGNFAFAIPDQVVSGTTYVPDRSSGYMVAGNATLISFTPVISTSTATSTSTSTVLTTVSQPAAQPKIFNMSAAGGKAKGTFLLSNSKVRINMSGSVVKSLSLNLKTSGIRVNFSVANSSKMPAAYATPSNPVYQFIQINGSLSTNPNINIDPFLTNVTYNFTVPISWVQGQGGNASSITLLKYAPSTQAWNPLQTSLTGSNATAYFYSAISNSFSGYAVSYNSFNTIGTGTAVSLTISGYFTTNFFVFSGMAGGLSNTVTNTIANVVVDRSAEVANTVGSARNLNTSVVGHGTVPIGTITYSSCVGGCNTVIAGIGANVIYTANTVNGNFYYSAGVTASSTTYSRSYTVPRTGSVVIILYSIGGSTWSAVPTTSAPGNSLLQDLTQSTYAESSIIVVNSLAAGTYTANAITRASTAHGSYVIAAYVFPPYSVTFNDLPSTGTITTNGLVQNSGNTLFVIGTNGIIANAPAIPGNLFFGGWSASNANLIISNSIASSTFLTVEGSSILTASWAGSTTFAETGLPTSVAYSWSVSNANMLQVSSTNQIIFPPIVVNNYPYQIPDTVVNNVVYHPNPAYGIALGGNTVSVAFTPVYVVSNSSSSLFTTLNTVSLAMPVGFAAYLYAAGANTITSTNWVPDNAVKNFESVGDSTTAFGNVIASTNGISIAGLGANALMVNGQVYSVNSVLTSAGSVTLSYTVSNSNSYVVLIGGSSNGIINMQLPWVNATSMKPYGAYVTTACAVGGPQGNFIYCGGGWTGAINLNTVYFSPMLSTGIGSWMLTNALPDAREDRGAAATSNAVYFFAGYNRVQATYATNVYYANILPNGQVSNWIKNANSLTGLPSYPTTCVAAQSYGYVYCQLGGSTTVNYAQILPTNALGTFATTNAYTISIYEEALVLSGNTIYGIGGYSGGDTATVEYARILPSGALSTWTTTNAYPLALRFIGCASPAGSNIIYCAGGFNEASSPANAYFAPILSSGGVGTWTATNALPTNQYPGSYCGAYSGAVYCIDPYYGVGAIPYTTSYFATPTLFQGTGSCPMNPPAYFATSAVEGSADCLQNAGTLSVSATSSAKASVSFAAYVFPPYPVNLVDSPSTGNIFTLGSLYASGSTINVIGSNTILAVPPTGYTFGNWVVSNPANLILASPTTNPTTLYVLGSGKVTANYYGNTIFQESGLPNSGESWNVVYRGVLQSATVPSNIVFNTLPGNFPFTVNTQVVSGTTYTPSPASGNLVTFNSTTITFTSAGGSTCYVTPDVVALNFGSVSSGTASSWNGVLYQNTGGTSATYLYVASTNWIFSANSAFGFYAANTVWSPTQSGGTAAVLFPSTANTNLLIPAGGSNTVYYRLSIPNAQPANSYTSNIIAQVTC